MVYCEWDQRPNNEQNNVYTTPLVVELAALGTIATRELVFTTWEAAGSGRRVGTMRVIATHDPTPAQNGANPQCQQLDQVSLESIAGYSNFQLRPAYGAQLAAGDLNQDNKPEIVGLFARGNGSLLNDRTFLSAIEFNTTNGVMSHNRLWVGRVCDGDPNTPDRPVSAGINETNAGPSLYDLGNDLRPEIIWERHIFDADGCLLSGTTGCQVVTTDGLEHWQCTALVPTSSANQLGVFNVVEDIDNDGRLELVSANRVDELSISPGAMSWIVDPSWNPSVGGPQAPLEAGLVAIANLTERYIYNNNDTGASTPEIVTVTTGTSSLGKLRILSNQGKILWERPLVDCATPNSNGNRGGPPTIADFDGDGYPEIGVAGACYYAVYDPDCGGETDPSWAGSFRGAGLSGTCNATNGATFGPGVLWAAPVTDQSSNATGSTVFDFDADGRAEVVYRDECQLWVFAGLDGTIKPSPSNSFDYIASNNTGYEYPTVADIVSEPPPNAGANYNDPTAAEIVIPRGRAGAGACDALYNPFNRTGGVVVVQQRDHAWAPTLPQWHQHAYAVTSYLRGRILSKADGSWLKNWLLNRLNNFRANPVLAYNTPGTTDLTARLEDRFNDFICPTFDSTDDLISGFVCNRGSASVDLSANGGVPVVFQVQGSNTSAPNAWRTFNCQGGFVSNEATDLSITLTGTLNPGSCRTLTCMSGVPTFDLKLRLVVDPPLGSSGMGVVEECFESNNASISQCVNGPPTQIKDGICGSAAGASTASAPTFNLCANGNPTSVSGSGPYSWSCLGFDGGSNAACASNRSCSSTSTSWAQSGLLCAASLPSANHGASATATDATSPNTGSRTYSCNQGSLSATNAGTCVERIRPIGCLSIGYELCGNGVDDDCNGIIDEQPCLSKSF